MEDIMSHKIVAMLSFIYLVWSIFKTIKSIPKFVRQIEELFKNDMKKNMVKNIFSITLYLIMVLVIPLIIIILSWNIEFSWIKLSLLILSSMIILGFIGGVAILVYVGHLVKDVDIKKDSNSVHNQESSV